jgi:hypothetical protein
MILNLKAVIATLGALLFFLGVALLAPMGVGLIYGEASWWSFGATALLSMGVGAAAWYFNGRTQQDLRVREGFAIVALAWFVLSLMGAVPFVLGGVLESYTDAFFETMSGFTTTGATILGGANTPAIEDLPNAFLFWRSLAHWLGGMGIIVLPSPPHRPLRHRSCSRSTRRRVADRLPPTPPTCSHIGPTSRTPSAPTTGSRCWPRTPDCSDRSRGASGAVQFLGTSVNS